MRSGGSPPQGDGNKSGPQVGRSATSPLRSRGSQNKARKSKVAHKWAELVHHPAVLRGPKTRGQSQRWPTSGRVCTTPLRSRGLLPQGDVKKSGPQVRGSAKSPQPSQGRETKEAKKRRNCYITPAFSGVHKKGDKVKGGPQVGGSAMSPLRSWGSQNKGTTSKVAHKGAEVLHYPCVLGGPLEKGDGNKSGPQVGGSATSPWRPRGS